MGVGQAPDGSGTITFAPLAQESGRYLATAGDNLGNLTFTYSATGLMEGGAQIVIAVDPDWGNTPVANNGNGIEDEGEVVLTQGAPGTLDVPGDGTISVTIEEGATLNSGDSFTVTYRAITAPTTGGDYDFVVSSKSTAGGELRTLAGSPITVNVEVIAAGTVALTDSAGELMMPITPETNLGDLTFTFTAGVQLASGAQVQIEIPDGWSPPFRGNNAADSRSGAIWVAGATVGITPGTEEAGPWEVTATTNAVIANGGTLTFTYRAVKAPPTPRVDEFTTKVSIEAGGTLLEVSNSPKATVREPVTAIAIEAESEFFSVDGLPLKVTLWGASGLAKAYGSMVVELSDGDGGGSFEDADGNALPSITIVDNTSEMSAVYQNASAGMVTLTAMSSGLEPVTHDVTIKSGITNLDAEPDVASAGQDVTITATGKPGGGNVMLSFVDADGNTVSLDKGLDPVDDPNAGAGEQSYTRTITLPAAIPEGEHEIKVTIADLSDSVTIEVLNDQTPPTLSDARILPTTVANGTLLTLTVKASSSSESNPVESVTADVSAVDNDSTEVDTTMIPLTAQPGTDNTYFAIHTVSMDNTNDDGVVDVTFTATDQIGGKGSATASVTLANDVTVIESVNVPSDLFRPGDTVTITATGTPGGTASFDVATDAHDVKLGGKAMKEDPDGTYTGSFEVVRDIFPEGTYYVTVNLNTKSTSTTGSEHRSCGLYVHPNNTEGYAYNPYPVRC